MKLILTGRDAREYKKFLISNRPSRATECQTRRMERRGWNFRRDWRALPLTGHR